ncbi:MAG: hypothetical protein JW722_03535 [Demequinaceae bacterium]|nr:hypothetical protein [Demequinaceae bacterium]
MDPTLVEDPDDARAFVEAPRTEKDRVILKVGAERLELNRWGTVLVSALVAGSPMLRKAVKVLRPRRIKRPSPSSQMGRSVESSTPLSTATVAAPLGDEASVEAGSQAKPSKAMRRATRRVRQYASGSILVATDADAARCFLTHALATPDPVIAEYRDREVVLTPDGARAVLALFTRSKLRLALVHLLLGADAHRPHPDGLVEPVDPADPWGPFPNGSLTLG